MRWEDFNRRAASLQHALLGKQLSQARLVHDRPVEDILKFLPPQIIEPKYLPVCQGVLGGFDSCIKQKVRDVHVC